MNNFDLADPQKLEDKHVHKVYDEIADHFGHTRYKPWPKVVAFLQKHSKSIVLDLGCGNAKYTRKFTAEDGDILFMKKSAMASLKPVELVRADIMNPCFKSEIADVTMAIAVLHHISTQERRVHAIREMIRCTKPGGAILIYVWAKKQEKGTIGSRSFDTDDCFVPWTKEGKTLMRYYHVFEPEEIVAECRMASEFNNIAVTDVSTDCNNIVVILEKTMTAS